jgi:Single Cache domain 2
MRRWTFTTMLAGLACTVAVCGPPLAQAQTHEGGSPAEARAMLERAVEALRADKQKALTAFSRGAKGFSQRDLYVFCFGPDGKLDAHPNPKMIGKDARLLKDKDGKAFGLEILQEAKPGIFAEVTYWWPEPPVSGDGAYGEPTLWGGLENWSNDPVRKTSYVTQIDDHVCGVGYYH